MGLFRMSTVVFYNGSMYADTRCTHLSVSKTKNYNVNDIIKIETTRKLFHLPENAATKESIIGFDRFCLGPG